MNNPGVYKLFVYGSLRSGFRSPAYEYVSSFFTFEGDAKVQGKLYHLGSHSAAIPASENTFIIGELYRINNVNEFSWAMGQLDDYEGVVGDADEARLYRREITEVYLGNEVTHAWIYWYNGDVSGKPLILSGDLMEYIKTQK